MDFWQYTNNITCDITKIIINGMETMKTIKLSKKMKIVIAGVAAAFVVVIGGMAGLGAYASGLETSMPGLSIKGIDVGKRSPKSSGPNFLV